MSEPATEVQPAAESVLQTAPPSTAPTVAATEAAPNAPAAAIGVTGPPVEAVDKPAVPEYPPLPSYALSYAPLLWLHQEEMYWPGDPFEHLTHTTPQKQDGTKIVAPDEILGKIDMLRLPEVDQADTFMCLAVSASPINESNLADATLGTDVQTEDPRINAKIEDLMSTKGKPNPHTRRSSSASWIVSVDKSKIVEPGVVDIFHFCEFLVGSHQTRETSKGSHLPQTSTLTIWVTPSH